MGGIRSGAADGRSPASDDSRRAALALRPRSLVDKVPGPKRLWSAWGPDMPGHMGAVRLGPFLTLPPLHRCRHEQPEMEPVWSTRHRARPFFPAQGKVPGAPLLPGERLHVRTPTEGSPESDAGLDCTLFEGTLKT